MPVEDRREYSTTSIGVRGSCELPEVGPGNRTLVLWKKSQCP